MKTKSKRRASPTQKTMKELKKLGFTAHIVEKKIPYSFISVDCFGVGDILAMREGIGIVLIQATTNTGGQHTKHLAKCYAEEKLKTWLLCGGRFEIWSWAKQGARNKRKLWVLRRQEIFIHDIPGPGEKAVAA